MKRITFILIILMAAAQLHAADRQVSISQMMTQRLNASQRDGQDNDEDLSFPISGNNYDKHLKSPSRAALYSLILPGAGQYYVEKNYKFKMFLGIEAGLWTTYFGFRKYGDFKDDASRGWAVLHADADPANRDNDYWVKMTYYDNRDRNEDDGLGYNQMAAVYDRGDAKLFPETPTYYWNWDTYNSRQKYRNLRNQSKTAFERADIAVGIIIANHIVSSLEAFFSAAKLNRHLEFSDSGFQLRYKLKPNLKNPAVSVSLVKNF